MSLRDFMKQLQEEDEGVVYSKPAEENIQIIPPVNMTSSVKIIPPEPEPPKVIKFKLKSSVPPEEKREEKKEPSNAPPVVVIPPKREKVQQEVIVEQKQEEKQTDNQQENIERLFIESGTDISKKERWMEYYNKATSSKKENIITNKLRRGRFRIRLDSEGPGPITSMPDVEILSDYVTYNKSTQDILDDKWL